MMFRGCLTISLGLIWSCLLSAPLLASSDVIELKFSCEQSVTEVHQLLTPSPPSQRFLSRALNAIRSSVYSLRPTLFSSRRPPATVSTTTSPNGAGPLPTSKVHVESKSVKELREDFHLSAAQVNDYLRYQKQIVIEAMRDLNVPVSHLFLDFKSLRFEVPVSEYPPDVVGAVVASLDQKLRAYLSNLLRETYGISSQPLQGLPLMTIGSSLEHHVDAGFAARFSPPQVAIYHFEEQEELLSAMLVSIEALRRELVVKLKTLYPGLSDGLLAKVKLHGEIVEVPSLRTQVLAKRYPDPDLLRQKLSRILPGAATLDADTVDLIKRYLKQTAFFRPPLEYYPGEIRLLDDDAEPSEEAESVLQNQSDFFVSSDLESVGAHHALAIQSQLARGFISQNSLSLSGEDLKKLLRRLTYGPSLQRLRTKLKETRFAFEKWGLGTLASVNTHITGDEWAASAVFSNGERSVEDLMRRVPQEVRFTFVRIADTPLEVKVRAATPTQLEVLEDEISHLRHISESVSKALSERLLDFQPPDLNSYSWGMEVVPTSDKGEFKIRVWSQAFQSRAKPSLEEIKKDLQNENVPITMLARFQAIEWMVP